MKIQRLALIILMAAGVSTIAAHAYKGPQFGTYTQDRFQDYWYNQGAEIK